jgi:hypothetical protein
MALYNIYCGSCNSPHLAYTDEFETLEEAEAAAYEAAIEDYDSYAGLHGIPSEHECNIDWLQQNGHIDDETDEIPDDLVITAEMEEEMEDNFKEEREAWLVYYVRLASEDDEYEGDDDENYD